MKNKNYFDNEDFLHVIEKSNIRTVIHDSDIVNINPLLFIKDVSFITSNENKKKFIISESFVFEKISNLSLLLNSEKKFTIDLILCQRSDINNKPFSNSKIRIIRLNNAKLTSQNMKFVSESSAYEFIFSGTFTDGIMSDFIEKQFNINEKIEINKKLLTF